MKPLPMLSYEFCALTDTGRVRSNNEDAVAIHETAQMVILADGMGGYNAGEVAAGMAITYIGTEMVRWLQGDGSEASPSDVRHALEACVDNANHAILGASMSNPQYLGMGTTLVVGVFRDDRLILGHIGDSRCYRWREGLLRQITRDHSWLQEQIDLGLLTPAQAAVSGQRNLVTRALGVDVSVHIEINEFPVEPGDLFILCSDGLTDMLSDEDLAELARMPIALQDKAARMVAMANAMGGRDNISVVLAQTQLAQDAKKRGGLMARLLGTS
ncbi:Stp1/IreP family PP2C-type Ser/Thr phosphatase [[Acidovorax] ebreus]|uniref:Stp1/IreP family PP2C-type Ser/Thr phosphatase n=1 Tax=Diaphorobacter sp. LI3 TaxID=2952886 RepID=UPI00205E91B5|nr:Stp1/IreP family PP2C-type Ser/Thr phosphatase [Diaphorobacter sp. LI3]